MKRAEELDFEGKVYELARQREDFFYFCKNVLSYKDMNEEHERACKFVQMDGHRFKLVLMPRFTFKSCIFDIGYALWKLVRNPNERILIYSDSATKASGFLLGIKHHILGESGSRFREWYPKWETDQRSGKWNESQIEVSVREKAEKEPSIDTGGIETSKAGMHYDTIIFDDIVSDLNVTTKAQMDKVYDCYRNSLSLLKPRGDIMVVGTRWHFNDSYGRIIAENKTRDTFGLWVRPAVEGNKYLFDNTGENALTKEFLDHQRREQGSYIYSCLYQNQPVDNEVAIFKSQDFEFYGELKKSQGKNGVYENLFITGTLDPAGEGEDYTSGVVCGTDAGKKIYVLDILNKQHCTPNEMIDWILKMNWKYRFKVFGIETTFFRGMLERMLEDRMKEERRAVGFNNFRVEQFQTRWRKGEGKRARIMSLQPYHERGDILFPGDCLEGLRGEFSDLAYQMMQVTPDHMPEPNDLIDALSWQVEIVQAGGMPEKEGPKERTPAWLEREWIDNHNRLQARLPRRMRRYWGAPSLA